MKLESELDELVEDSKLEEFEFTKPEPDDILPWELKKICGLRPQT